MLFFNMDLTFYLIAVCWSWTVQFINSLEGPKHDIVDAGSGKKEYFLNIVTDLVVLVWFLSLAQSGTDHVILLLLHNH